MNFKAYKERDIPREYSANFSRGDLEPRVFDSIHGKLVLVLDRNNREREYLEGIAEYDPNSPDILKIKNPNYPEDEILTFQVNNIESILANLD